MDRRQRDLDLQHDRETGHFAVLRRSFGSVSDDQRIQAVIIAFSFGALIEALAGFGTPVAISSVMLIALGFKPIKAASVALVANTAPVAFGAIAIPIVTLGQVTGLPKDDLGSMVGRQTPLLAVIVPLILVGDGRRPARHPPGLAGGAWSAGSPSPCVQFAPRTTSRSSSPTSSPRSLRRGAWSAFLRVWQPSEPLLGERADGRRPAIAGAATARDPELERDASSSRATQRDGDSRARGRARLRAVPDHHRGLRASPRSAPSSTALADAHEAVQLARPATCSTARARRPSRATFKFDWLPAAGTLLLISGLLTMSRCASRPCAACAPTAQTLNQLKWAIVTVCAVLALAYVMNLSGQTITIGTWVAGAGAFFAFLSPIIGWLGTAVTGSDTSSNSLFGALQVTAAKKAGLNPTLLAAANSSGGVLGKMISPQNLAIGAAAVGMAGKEGEIFRKVIGWSLRHAADHVRARLSAVD